MKITKSQSSLLKLLHKKEKESKKVTIKDITDATKWSDVTFKTYFNKGQFSEFLSEIQPGIYEVTNTITLTEIEFAKKLSQSKYRRELGHNCKSKLAKALLKKSKENMLLAIELYNRPSLENKLDGFVFLFCVAWEQLLKAIIIEKQGEEKIYRKNQKVNRIRESISLRDCLECEFEKDNLIRKNIEKITFYRDQAVHLLMQELQGIMSRVFQAGILNYSQKFEEFSEQQFISINQSGMISLVGDFKSASITSLQTKYGNEIGIELDELVTSLTDDINSYDDGNLSFAIPLNVKMIFARKDDKGNVVTLARAEEGMEGLKKAIVVEKAVDQSKTHPFIEKTAISEINKELSLKYGDDFLKEHLVFISKEGKKAINKFCFQAIVDKLKFKSSDSKYHYKSKIHEHHYYSYSAIEKICKHIIEDKNFVVKARESYSNKRKKVSKR